MIHKFSKRKSRHLIRTRLHAQNWTAQLPGVESEVWSWSVDCTYHGSKWAPQARKPHFSLTAENDKILAVSTNQAC